VIQTITREELALAAVDASGLTLAACRKLVDQTIEEICATLERHEDVKLFRFGSFTVHRSPARVGRNPMRPTELHPIPERWAVRFRASSGGLRDRVAEEDWRAKR
jgi:nucleoid DNA-binding protein